MTLMQTHRRKETKTKNTCGEKERTRRLEKREKTCFPSNRQKDQLKERAQLGGQSSRREDRESERGGVEKRTMVALEDLYCGKT